MNKYVYKAKPYLGSDEMVFNSLCGCDHGVVYYGSGCSVQCVGIPK